MRADVIRKGEYFEGLGEYHVGVVAGSSEGRVGAVSVGMIQCAEGSIHRSWLWAERADVVPLGLEAGAWSGVVVEGGGN